jgi:hypothetical protein
VHIACNLLSHKIPELAVSLPARGRPCKAPCSVTWLSHGCYHHHTTTGNTTPLAAHHPTHHCQHHQIRACRNTPFPVTPHHYKYYPISTIPPLPVLSHHCQYHHTIANTITGATLPVQWCSTWRCSGVCPTTSQHRHPATTVSQLTASRHGQHARFLDSTMSKIVASQGGQQP